jgi:hypothetical protein
MIKLLVKLIYFVFKIIDKYENKDFNEKCYYKFLKEYVGKNSTIINFRLRKGFLEGPGHNLIYFSNIQTDQQFLIVNTPHSIISGENCRFIQE